MSKSVYKRACRYAYKLTSTEYKDLVHQTWLDNYNRKGTDLFKMNIYYILQALKLSWWRELERRSYQHQGVVSFREFVDITSLELAGGCTPDRALMSQEFVDTFNREITGYTSNHHSSINTGTLLEYVFLISQGWNQTETAKRMGMSPQRIHYYKTKVVEIINRINHE